MRNAVVVDTSIALKWVLNEEDSAVALALLTEWTKNKVKMLAPALLAYEATNTLYQNARKGKITFSTARLSLTTVILAGFKFDQLRDPFLSMRALELAEKFNLPAAYDAYYLALAEREHCPFWTADIKMWQAVKGEINWVRILQEYTPSF